MANSKRTYFDYVKANIMEFIGDCVLKAVSGKDLTLQVDEDNQVIVSGGEVKITKAGGGVTLTSPDGTEYKLTVSDEGSSSIAEVK
jgi:hypothetical protein